MRRVSGALALSASMVPVSGTAVAASPPHTIVTDGAKLASIRHGADRRPVVGHGQAVRAAEHDYTSQAPYWWASRPKAPENPQGCPYVSKDGQRNPAAAEEARDPDAAAVLERMPLPAGGDTWPVRVSCFPLAPLR